MKQKPLKILVGLFMAIGVAVGAYLGILQMTGNFHEVVPGQLYRSAQPSAADILTYGHDFGIKTIVNLRGRSKHDWYSQELAAAKQAGIEHIDFKMSASRELTLDQTHQLVAILRDAPKPILIHCQAGADRTGLVSVIYLQQIAGVDEDTAEEQLSLRYGHVGVPYLSAAFAMDKSWAKLEKVFGLDG